MKWQDVIVVDPEVCHGQACFKGTRILVHVVLDNLAEGRSTEDILNDFPSLSPRFVNAAIAYAADIANERIIAVPESV